MPRVDKTYLKGIAALFTSLFHRLGFRQETEQHQHYPSHKLRSGYTNSGRSEAYGKAKLRTRMYRSAAGRLFLSRQAMAKASRRINWGK